MFPGNPKKAMRCIVTALMLVAAVFAAPPEAVAETEPTKGDLTTLPFAYYTPETETAFLLLGIYTVPGKGPGARPSTYMGFITYTTLRQTMVEFFPDLYTENGFRISGGIGTMNFPDKFYGIGPDVMEEDEEEYSRLAGSVDISVQYEFIRDLYLGLKVDFEDLLIVLSQWTAGLPPAVGGATVSIVEPTDGMLLHARQDEPLLIRAVVRDPDFLAVEMRFTIRHDSEAFSYQGTYAASQEDGFWSLRWYWRASEYALPEGVFVIWAEALDETRTSAVSQEVTVTIQEEDFPHETYHLVGPTESDPNNGKISHESPIGKALIGHRAGDVVETQTPGGTVKFKIIKTE